MVLASTRLLTLSLRKILCSWVRTVLTETTSSWAISAFELPAANKRKTLRSCELRGSLRIVLTDNQRNQVIRRAKNKNLGNTQRQTGCWRGVGVTLRPFLRAAIGADPVVVAPCRHEVDHARRLRPVVLRLQVAEVVLRSQ